MPYLVQDLIEGHAELASVQRSTPVPQALALMVEHDYSQLPVVDETNQPLGIITYESIVRALSSFRVSIDQLIVANAMDKHYEYGPEDDLFELLDRLQDVHAVLIVNGEKKLVGIVTRHDAMAYFRRRTEDFMLVEDIESMIKDLVLAPFANDAHDIDQAKLAAAIAKITSSSKPFDKLTLSQYTELLLEEDLWDHYRVSFGLEADALRNLLSDVRETRNMLAHFRGDISPVQRDQLKFCADWLSQHHWEGMTERPSAVAASAFVYPTEQLPAQQMVAEAQAAAYEVKPASAEGIVPSEEASSPGYSRYTPLGIWLTGLLEDKVRVTFAEIERIIDDKLPESAYQHRAWWSNDSTTHVQSQQWLDAGWRVSTVNMTDKEVVFIRTGERKKSYISFFNELLRQFRTVTPFLMKKTKFPKGLNWHIVRGLPDGGPQRAVLSFTFAHHRRFRVELYIDGGDAERNKRAFDLLHAQKDRIETAVGDRLEWERITDRRPSRIALYRAGAITDSAEELTELRAWAIDAMVRFFQAIREPANQALKSAWNIT